MLPTAAEEFGIPLAVVEPVSLGCFALQSSPTLCSEPWQVWGEGEGESLRGGFRLAAG